MSGHRRDDAVRTAGRLPELPAVVAAGGTQGPEPAQNLATGRRRADEERMVKSASVGSEGAVGN